MSLYDEFKTSIPSNQMLCEIAAHETLLGLSDTYIKENFSDLFEKLNAAVYDQYLVAQKESGQAILEERAKYALDGLYSELDSFYMSIFQSRRSRAGIAFELVIREFFVRLDYPFAEQVDIEGAKPDFVMPSEAHFRTSPLDCIIFTAKRTLRERWRQVVTEANKGYGFFLATMDKNISKSQIEQMAKHKVYMVVPLSLLDASEPYSSAHNVLSFEDFFLKHLDPAVDRWADNWSKDSLV